MIDPFVKRLKTFLESRQAGPWDPSYLNGTKALLEELERALAQIGRPAMVLDVGCGSTDHYERKGRYGPRIRHLIGIDVIADLGTNESLDYVTRASVYNLRFRSFQFDVAFSDFVIEHLEHPERALEEIARVLTPGGYFVFRTPNLYHYVPVVALLLQKAGCLPHMRFSTDGERHGVFPVFYGANTCRHLKVLAKASGFAVEEIMFAEGGPHYLEFFLPFCLIGVMHQYLVNKVSLLHGYKGNIIGLFRKVQSARAR